MDQRNLPLSMLVLLRSWLRRWKGWFLHRQRVPRAMLARLALVTMAAAALAATAAASTPWRGVTALALRDVGYSP